MKYREANLDDLECLRGLEQRVVDAERPYNSLIRESGAHYYDIEQLIVDENCYMLVGEAGGVTVATGYAKIRESKPSLAHAFDSYLGFMFVAPAYRGQGVNREIMNRLISWSRDKGVTDFYLDVYSENTPAINAYVKAGFSESIVEMKLSL